MRRFLIATLLMATLAGGGVAWQQFGLGTGEPKAQTTPRARAVPVLAAEVVRKATPVRIETIGTVQPLATVAIKSRVDGQITRVHFTEGQDVKQGDVLFTLDSRQIEAQGKQVEAQLAKDRAQFANARREVERQQELVVKSFTSGAKFDEMRTAAASLEAQVRADEAALENIRVQISYHTIVSPLDGRTGAVTLKAGNNVKANEASLVTINQVRPLYVSFSVPQRDLAEVRAAMKEAALETVVQPIGESPATEKGQLSFIDNQIEAATGTIALKATFANKEDRLWPGQFVNVILTLRVEPDALTIPSAAIQAGQNGSFVYVVKPDLTVEPRDVEIARTVDGVAVIAGGLKESERVVIDGQLRLTRGTKVELRAEKDGKGLTS